MVASRHLNFRKMFLRRRTYGPSLPVLLFPFPSVGRLGPDSRRGQGAVPMHTDLFQAVYNKSSL